ncbi:hypothetical protein CDAR_411091 [Caerostris darwini]|uniref:Uncharacterized protein n=1 Tax=Caerostris darwini TaxID=1538125 RepID=A0AAV4SFP5_9ARAC|nr:hypothetical protein CDAR_411091 [Caerostris darwini]
MNKRHVVDHCHFTLARASLWRKGRVRTHFPLGDPWTMPISSRPCPPRSIRDGRWLHRPMQPIGAFRAPKREKNLSDGGSRGGGDDRKQKSSAVASIPPCKWCGKNSLSADP